MAYYHDLVTEKSWRELQQLHQRIDFVLIGGWAVYLYTQALKSKDIDVVIDYHQLPALQKYYDLTKNDRLKKYQARRGEVEIDIYLPHYSELGIPVEELILHTHSLEGFGVLKLEYLLALKIYTLSQRGRSAKGKKDLLDVISLLEMGNANVKQVQALLTQHGLSSSWKTFQQFLSEYTHIPELGLSAHAYAKLKRQLIKKK